MFGLGRNCIIGSMPFHCYEYSFAVPIGSCCNVNSLENHEDSGYFLDTESWYHAVKTFFMVSHTALHSAGVWLLYHNCEV